MTLPRVLIYGQPFNKKHGGGITLSNLFKGWDKDKIAVAATGHVMYDVTTDICDTYYQLGSEEFMWRFPFNLIQKKFPSGLLAFDFRPKLSSGSNQSGLRYILVNQLFYPAMEWLGLFHSASRIKLSTDFKNWLFEFKPEILYLQVSTRETILFAAELKELLRIPSAIHMMDDWPSTISKKGLFRKYWERKIDKEFRDLLNKTDLFLSISDAMSSEYLNRYNKVFKAFHNPIDTTVYCHKYDNSFRNDAIFRILYLGRIGVANKHSIFSFAESISRMRMRGRKFILDIFTPDIDALDTRKIGKLNSVRINPAVKHEMVPRLLTEYDLLLLPLDFTKNGLKYARYSIPTKASEYMISGTPILVYAPKETAIFKFCSENKCGHCLSEQSQGEIAQAIQLLVTDMEYRKKLSNNAIRIASGLFNVDIVKDNFRNLLLNLAESSKS